MTHSTLRRLGGAFVLSLVASLLPVVPSGAEEASSGPAGSLDRRIEELEKKIEELARQLAAARGGPPALTDEQIAELSRRLDVLAAEVERLRAGLASEEAPLAASRGLGPAAAKVYGRDRGVAIGGYGEVIYQNLDSRSDRGEPSGARDTLDSLRAVVYFGYKFEKGIVFNSEIEFEHGTTGEGAEEKGGVSVEFAYLDFPLGPSWGVRAGQMLVPAGLVNEFHEAPVFLGAARPDVERLIIPSTWREVGAGAYGESGSVSWRAYVQGGLDASQFSAAGIRKGRQSGSRTKAEDLALAARVDWEIVPGLTAGAFLYGGDAGQGLRDTRGRPIRARTTLFDVHAELRARGWQLKGLFARGRIADAERLNRRLGLEGLQSIGKENFGWYAEAGYDLLRARGESAASLIPFARYERYDTQDDVPAGFLKDPARDVRLTTAGLAYKPIPNTVVKADYQDYKNEAGNGVDRFNLAVGYLF